MQLKLQRRPCGFFKPLFPVSLQQLLVVTVKDCKLLRSIATLPYVWNLNTNKTTLSALKYLSCAFVTMKAERNIAVFYNGIILYILSA